MIRGTAQRGYILMPVMVVITLVAAIALMMNTESAIESNTTSSELDAQLAQYVAEAGLNHGLWQAKQQGCGPYGDLTDVALGNDQYTTNLTTDLGSITSYTVVVDQDSWIRNDVTGQTHPTESALHLTLDSGDIERPVYRFDVATIPATSVILSATAWLYVNKEHPEGPVEIHALSLDWTEAEADWDLLGDRMDSVVLATIPAQPVADVWVSINLTSQVQAWVNDEPNYGIALNALGEGDNGEYASRESANEPYLEVIVGVPPSSPATLNAVGTLQNGVSRSITRNDLNLYQQSSFHRLQLGIDPGADAMLDSFYNLRNYGGANYLQVHDNGSDWQQYPVIRFELSGLPAGASVHSARLELRMQSLNAPGSATVHRVTRSWVEGTKSGGGQPDGATWGHYDGVNGWTSAGGDYNASAVAETAINGGETWVSWEIAPLVKRWLAGEPNYGLLIKPDSALDEAKFASREDGDATVHPKLTITYACECGQVCVAPQGTGKLLIVVKDPDLMVAEDTQAKDLFESWGYTVTLIDDNSSQTSYDTVLAASDVVFISATVDYPFVGIRLKDAAIGVVNQHGAYNADLGLASGNAFKVGTEINITDTDHFITRPFPLGALPIYASGMEQLVTSGALTADQQTLADIDDNASLVLLDEGAELEGGGNAAGRRVVLPLGTRNRFNWGHLNANGRLIVQRALQWGAGDSGEAPLGFYRDEFNSLTCDFSVDYAGSDGTLEWSAQPWTEVTDIDNSCTSAGKLFDDLGSTVARIAEAGKGFMRPVDLSAFSTAWLHFDYRLESLNNSTDMLSVSVSGDGGTNWIEVAQFTGPADDAAYLSADIDISPHAGADTVIRFMSVNTSATELIHFDNVQIDDSPPTVPGPIAHWKLDDGVGLTAIDSEGGHDGSLNGPPAWTMGNIDGALDFDGGDNYVDVGSFNVTGTGITMMGWFNAEVLGTEDGRIISKANGVNEADAWWQLSTTDVGASRFLRMRIKAGGTTTTLADASVNLSTSQWYFAVATYDNASGEMKLYLDGTELASNIHDVGGALDTDATVPVAIGANGTAERFFDGILDDMRVYDYAIDATEVSNLYSASTPPAPPGYNETYATWSATANDTWQVVDLAPFGVPAGAVVEVAVVNSRDNFQYWGGVRSVGSALDRRLQLHEAESGGTDVMVMHVQADAASQIEHYSDTADISFILLGWWGSSTFEERWDPFPADVEGAWHSKPLQGFGVSSGSVAEVVIRNVTQGFKIRGGVREAGSTLSRIIEIHEAEGGGDDTATMFVNTSTDASASVEVYTDDTGLKYILAGFWSTPPGTYTESGGAFGQVSSPASWETIDLTSFGVPANAVAQFMLANERVSEENLLGVRATDSAINNRLLNLQEAEAGGSDLGSMHVNVDTSSQVQWTAEYGATGAKFYPVGWWVLTP